MLSLFCSLINTIFEKYHTTDLLVNESASGLRINAESQIMNILSKIIVK